MSKPTPPEMMNAFMEYNRKWQELDRQYYQIPSWRIFKQLANIRKREKLTKAYTVQMKEWGII